MNKKDAAKKKAEWLAYCLEIGFVEKYELDELSNIWDRFRDEHGNLRPVQSPTSIPRQEGEEKKETLASLMGLVRYGWNAAAQKIYDYCNESKVTEDFMNLLRSMLDENNKEKFVYELFEPHVKELTPPAVSDASEEVKALKEEVERLKVLIDKAYAIGWNVSTDKEDFEIKLHSFKKQNNL